MGYNNYKTANYLSKEKRGEAVPEAVSLDTEFKFHLGHILEESVAIAFYEKEHKKAKYRGKFEVFKDNSVFFNIRTGFMQANVDFFVEDYRGLHILECKTTANPALWKDKDVPMSYKTQALYHYPRCLEDLNITSTYFACLWNTNLSDLIVREFRRSKTQENVIERYEGIFNQFVIEGTDIPKGMFEESHVAIENEIKSKNPKAEQTDEPVIISEPLLEKVFNYFSIYKEKSTLESKARALSKDLNPYKTSIMEFLGDNAIGLAKIGGVDYKIDYSNKAKKYAISAANLSAIREEEPEIYIELLEKGYITVTEGRNFSIKEINPPKSKAAKKSKSETGVRING